MARFILELRRDDINDPTPVVQDWILDTNAHDSTADFTVKLGAGAGERLIEMINRAALSAEPRPPVEESADDCALCMGHVPAGAGRYVSTHIGSGSGIVHAECWEKSQ